MKRFVTLLVLCVATLFAQSGMQVVGPLPTGVSVLPSATLLAVGQTATLSAQYVLSDTTVNLLISNCIWTSSNTGAITLSVVNNVETATAVGSGTSTITCTPSGSNVLGLSGTTLLTVAAAPIITNPTCATQPCQLPSGSTTSSYTFTFTAGGGVAPYTWTNTVGSPPSGLTLNSSTGVLSGTPGSAGTTTWTVRVTDSSSNTTTVQVTLVVSSGTGQIVGATLPQNWTDEVCGASTTTYDETFTVDGVNSANHFALVPGTGATTHNFADGLQGALNAWAQDGHIGFNAHIVVTAGAVLHGGLASGGSNAGFDANNSLITYPVKVGATGCAVIESSSPPTAQQMVCSHGIPGQAGAARNPGCTTDIAHLWTLRIDTAPISGYNAIYACGGNGTAWGNPSCTAGGAPSGANHILLRDAEITISPGGSNSGVFQSVPGTNAPVLVQFEGGPDHLGIEYSYLHGWNPGDTGQPTAACIQKSTYPTVPYTDGGFLKTGGITIAPSSGTITWVAGDRFGMDFSDGTHSTGYPESIFSQPNAFFINGNGATISSHDPGATDTQITTIRGPFVIAGDKYSTPANITAVAITSNVVTVTAANNYAAGDLVFLTALAETYLNNQTVQVLSSGLSGSSYQVTFTHANLATHAETGQSLIAYALINPPTALPTTAGGGGTVSYATGCGDDIVSAVNFNVNSGWFQWNYVEKIHWFGSESHAISGGFMTGPYKIAHNWIEGGSAAFFNGGAALDTKGGIANDGEIRGNFFGRDLNYRFLTGGASNSPAPPWGCGPLGGHTASNGTCPLSWAIKNSIELKIGSRVLVNGNMVCCVWSDGQTGNLVLNTPRTSSGGNNAGIYDPGTGLPSTVVNNVTYSNDVFYDAPQAQEFGARSLVSPGNGGGLSSPSDFYTFSNNLWVIGDTGPFGNPGTDLSQWGGFSGQSYAANMTFTGTGPFTVTATTTPILMANCNAGPTSGTYTNTCTGAPVPVCDLLKGDDCGVFDQGISGNNAVTCVGNSGPIGGTVCGTVLPANTSIIQFNGRRFDPYVTASNPSSQNVQIWGPSAWVGSFPVTGAYSNHVNTTCSQPTTGPLAFTQPQPCVRSDGTFGDSLVFADSRALGTLCSTAAACTTAGFLLWAPTTADKMTDISVGDPVYTSNCACTTPGSCTNPSSMNIGASGTVAANAIAPTLPTGLTVAFSVPSWATGTPTGTITCLLQNYSGHPLYTSFNNNTVLSANTGTNGISILNGGSQHQQVGNQILNNVFAGVSGVSKFGVTCTNIAGEGNLPLTSCWNNGANPNLAIVEGNNLLVNQSSGTPPTVNVQWAPPLGIFGGSPPAANLSPTDSCTGATATSSCMGWTGFMSQASASILAPCSFTGNPLECRLQLPPWGTDLLLSQLTYVGSSSYTQGASISSINTAQTETQYSGCASNCGPHGPYPDFH